MAKRKVETIDKVCKICRVEINRVPLKKYYIGDNSENLDYCISCPNCHVVYDLIEKEKA